MFAEEAVFLDTAGRYTTQDSQQPVDAAAWTHFLGLIKKYRKQQPINGVLLTVSISDLLGWSETELDKYSLVVRQRIAELNAVLGIKFPVYLLLTKCDLIAGFNEFFESLDDRGRNQVWGETFLLGDNPSSRDAVEQFAGCFDKLVERLGHRTIQRIHEERDILRRGLILNFPVQLSMLKDSILRFLQTSFATSSYENVQAALRGVYFTSGTQEGTPIDRVMSRLAGLYGFERHTAPVYSGRGKSYFINQLLSSVVFGEAGLAGMDWRLVRTQRWVQLGVLAVISAAMAGLLAAWALSYGGNKASIQQVQAIIEKHASGKVTPTDDGDTAMLIARLDAWDHARAVYPKRSWWQAAGLYQGDKLNAGLQRAYSQMLQNHLLPAVLERLQLILGHSTAGVQPDAGRLYEVLKLYLMLGEPARIEQPDLFAGDLVRQAFAQTLDRQPEQAGQLQLHIENMCSMPFVPPSLDSNLIARARQQLNAVPIALQIFNFMKNRPGENLQDFKPQEVIGPEGAGIFTARNGAGVDSLVIPGFFTLGGYEATFRKKGLALIEQVMAQNWVLQNPALLQKQDTERLFADLQDLYFAEYRHRWSELLEQLQIVHPTGINDAINIIGRLVGPPSPLRSLLETVNKNTSFEAILKPPEKIAPEGGGKHSKSLNIFAGMGSTSASRVIDATRPAPPPGMLKVAAAFEDLNKLISPDGNGGAAPFEQVLQTLGGIQAFMMQTASAANSQEQALKMARQRMSGAGQDDILFKAKTEFSRLPEPARGWILSLTSFSWKLTLATAKGELKAKWQSGVVAVYRTSLQRRFPLDPNSPHDATIEDFSRFFAPNGILDTFFEENLKPFVDTSGPTWRLNKMDQSSIDIQASTIDLFQKASQIRRNFFPGGETKPTAQFELKPIYLNENVLLFRLNIEGQTVAYSHGPSQWQKVTWPGPQGNLGVRMTFLTGDGREIGSYEEGPWALLRLFDKAAVRPSELPEKYTVTFKADGLEARFELRAASVNNLFRTAVLHQFQLPESL